MLGLEVNSLEPAILRVFAEAGEQVAKRLASLDDHAVGKIDLRLLGVLGHQPVPIAGIERRKVLVEHRLRRRLLLQIGQLHLRVRSRSCCNDGDCRQ